MIRLVQQIRTKRCWSTCLESADLRRRSWFKNLLKPWLASGCHLVCTKENIFKRSLGWRCLNAWLKSIACSKKAGPRSLFLKDSRTESSTLFSKKQRVQSQSLKLRLNRFVALDGLRRSTLFLEPLKNCFVSSALSWASLRRRGH